MLCTIAHLAKLFLALLFCTVLWLLLRPLGAWSLFWLLLALAVGIPMQLRWLASGRQKG